MNFELATPARILFGEGRLGEVPAIASTFGSRALVVEGQSARAEPLVRLLGERGIAATRLPVSSEPTISLVEDGVRQARDARCDVVIALGGGSVIDAGKAIRRSSRTAGRCATILRSSARRSVTESRRIRSIAIPTTAAQVPRPVGTRC